MLDCVTWLKWPSPWTVCVTKDHLVTCSCVIGHQWQCQTERFTLERIEKSVSPVLHVPPELPEPVYSIRLSCLETGGGITERNLQRILEGSGAQEFHCSARSSKDSAMKFRFVSFNSSQFSRVLWVSCQMYVFPPLCSSAAPSHTGTPASPWEQHLSTAWRWQTWAKSAR